MTAKPLNEMQRVEQTDAVKPVKLSSKTSSFSATDNILEDLAFAFVIVSASGEYGFLQSQWRRLKGPTGIVAELLPLLAPAVDPDAEAHEDDPAGAPDARDEGWLLHHICNLLRQAHVPTRLHRDRGLIGGGL